MSQLGGMGGMGGMGGWAERVARGAWAGPAEAVRRISGVDGAGGSVLGTLADAYANPIMVDALILGREGTTVPDVDCYAPVLPAIDDPAQMERWEPWVRAYVAIGEMLPGIVSRRRPSDSRCLSSSSSLIAEIERPTKVTFETADSDGAQLGRPARRSRDRSSGADRSPVRFLVVNRLSAPGADQAHA